MGQKLVSEIIFQPPKGVDMVCINNTHYTTTSNNRKIPLLLFEYNSSIIYQPNLDHQLSQYNDQNKTGIKKEIYTNLGIEIKTDIKKERKARTTKNESETEILLTNKNDEVSKENGKKKKKKKEIKQQKKMIRKRRTKNLNKIAFPLMRESDQCLTILYSHANAESIFQLPFLAFNSVSQLKVNFCLYEYCGYPFTEGKCSEKNCYRSGQAALKWLNEEKNIPNSKIILMGHSLGAAVATDLALKNPDVYGLILLSPFLSCCKVPNIKFSLRSIDMFENWKKAPHVQVKILLIHGEKDEIVKIKHGKKLFKLFPNTVEPLWIKYAGHNDIEYRFGWELYPKLELFIYQDLLNHHNQVKSILESFKSLSKENDHGFSNC
ncbi:alpha/beta-hydrolases superfamily protein [Anaeramoeba flamelloides]|uniref:Alpha/beta-hydrolases superfamily protein n=1 Tax=Anaeramoeba flamelloides TaxID=1746091 RepID=A0AAV7YK74_9EUKA|nr:alpha/beta-hydrolases superfamily protein [Anaeramoeba flamelloides]